MNGSNRSELPVFSPYHACLVCHQRNPTCCTRCTKVASLQWVQGHASGHFHLRHFITAVTGNLKLETVLGLVDDKFHRDEGRITQGKGGEEADRRMGGSMKNRRKIVQFYSSGWISAEIVAEHADRNYEKPTVQGRPENALISLIKSLMCGMTAVSNCKEWALVKRKISQS